MLIVWLLGAALSASAHDLYPIRPVRATLRVEPDRLVADLRADSIIWIEEVTGLHPMPPRDWPAETLAKVETYVNGHFRLTAGGKPLPGKLVEARYRQFPWEVNEEGVFFLRLVYPPPAGAGSLDGTADFYGEYRRELEEELGGRPIPYKDGYRTILEVPGRRSAVFTLTPEAPSFSIPLGDSGRSAFAMAREALVLGTEAALGAAAGFPAVLAIALCLGAGAPSRAAVAALLAAAGAGYAAGSLADVPGWLIWAATLGASLSIGRRAAAPASAAVASCLGAAWGRAAGPLLPHSALAVPSALAGALAAGAGLLFIVRLGVTAEYRRLAAESESRVDRLFAMRARLAATTLAMVGAYGLWQSWGR